MTVSDIEVREVDPQDEAALRSWWEIGHAVGLERPYDLFPPWILSRKALPKDNPEIEVVLLGAYVDEQMVGAALMHMPRLDNLHMAYGDLYVLAEHRRRGVGTRILEAFEARARAAGRTSALIELPAPIDGENPGTLFAAARGLSLGNAETTKLLDLAESEPGWARLQAEVDERLGDYRIVTWTSPAPEEYVQGYCDLLSTFIGEIPLGDLPLEDAEWTPARFRANEQRNLDLGRADFCAAALAPDGSLVGVGDVRLMAAVPQTAYVGITLVAPAHRGHRLGLAIKLANHRSVRAAFPDCEVIVTGNAAANEHMNAVNEKLGYRVVERLLDMQKQL